MRSMQLLCAAAAAAALLGTAGIAGAATGDVPVDLELVLGVDISGSVDEVEGALQRDGYVAALQDPKVIAAIRGGILGRIAVTYFEWADETVQSVSVGWTLIDSEASARAFAARVAAAPSRRGLYTSISAALRAAAPMFDGNGFKGTRRVIDLSGDGPNNVGGLVTQARDEIAARRITINGLPIVNDRIDRYGAPMPNLDLYYRNCVIGGPGAFMVVAQDFRSFAVVVRRKLILEIAGLAPPAPPLLHRAAARWEPPCDAGERRLEERFRDNY
jgi:hypothetical protein